LLYAVFIVLLVCKEGLSNFLFSGGPFLLADVIGG